MYRVCGIDDRRRLVGCRDATCVTCQIQHSDLVFQAEVVALGVYVELPHFQELQGMASLKLLAVVSKLAVKI